MYTTLQSEQPCVNVISALTVGTNNMYTPALKFDTQGFSVCQHILGYHKSHNKRNMS